MTDPHGPEISESLPEPIAVPSTRRREADAVHGVCPLIQAGDGAWHSAYASRDHRCWAVRPPAPLAISKQRQLCLTPGHDFCSTFVATALRPSPESLRADGIAADLWPAVGSLPLVLEPTRGLTGALRPTASKAGGQALLVALMVLAFLVLVIARTTVPLGPFIPESSAAPGASGALTSAPAGSANPTPATSPGETASPSLSPPTAAPSRTPIATATARPSGGTTYRVRSGDTLSSIAARFGTTVKAIAAANGITDPSLIKVGQVLVIP